MYQASTNTTQEYCQKTRYNYVKNSDFWVSDCFFLCSPLLHYHYVSTSLTMQIPTETLSQTHRVCFMLLCYRSVTTTLTAQIPAETLSQTHRVFLVLRFCTSTALTVQIPNGNAIANSQGLLHRERKRLRNRLFLLRCTIL